MRALRIALLPSLLERVLGLAHEGHQGIVKTNNRLRSKLWWPKTSAMVERHERNALGARR